MGGGFREAEVPQHRCREDGFVYFRADGRPGAGQPAAGAATVSVFEALGGPLSSEQLGLLRVQRLRRGLPRPAQMPGPSLPTRYPDSSL